MKLKKVVLFTLLLASVLPLQHIVKMSKRANTSLIIGVEK